MVAAGKDLGRPLIFGNNREGSMSTDIVESVNFASVVTHNEDGKTGDLESNPITGFRESQFMADKDPATREYCSPFELVEIVRPVPRCWESSLCLRLAPFVVNDSVLIGSGLADA